MPSKNPTNKSEYPQPAYPVLRVVWEDSESCQDSTWHNLNEITEDRGEHHMICVSIGYLVKETPESVILVPHLSRDRGKWNAGSGDMEIPKRSILEQAEVYP